MEYPDFSEASCSGLDTNLFYFRDDRSREWRDLSMLRKMCANCPVVAECADWALHHELHGFWAGTTEADRKALRIKLGIEYSAPEGALYGIVRKANGA